MSMMFRLKYKLGLIPSAQKIDTEWAELIKLREELNSIENSEAFKRYNELKILTASYDFQLQKKEIQNLSFEGSPESDSLKELQDLERKPSIRDYFKILNSAELERFNKVKSGSEVKRYLEIKKEKESQQSRDQEKAGQIGKEFSKISRTPEVRFFMKFGESSRYANFKSVIGSYELERVEELRKITADPEFKKRVAYLKNKKRYLTTELYEREAELDALEKGDMLKRYRKLKKSPQLNFFQEWSLAFEEKFDKKSLDKARWQTENYWGYKLNGKSFSQADEVQGFNGEKNLLVKDDQLSIIAKREKVNGQSWNSKIGLIPKEFDYSSGIINSAESFRFREGAVEAKVKFIAEESLTNAFSLTGSMPMPQIDVFRSGKNCVGLGFTEMTENGVSRQYKQIYGLNFNQYHVFRLEKFDHTLVWKINGVPVHRIYYTGAERELFLNFITSLHEPIQNELIPHHFQIDWIRCFSKNAN